jgi:hypothetical protein
VTDFPVARLNKEGHFSLEEKPLMKRSLVLAVLTFASFVLVAGNVAAQRPWRGNVRDIIKDLETDTDHFKSSLDHALDRSRLNGTRTEDEINDYVKKFESATDRLRDRAEDRQAAPGLTREVLSRGRSIDVFMRRHRLGPDAETDWARVRNDLNRLANAYNVNWRW